MADWSELKRLIDRMNSLKAGDSADGDTWEAALEDYEEYLGSFGWDSPAAILALIAENEELEAEAGKCFEDALGHARAADELEVERDQLRAEVERFREGLGIAQRHRDELITENERLIAAMRKVMAEVDGNIRETVRDCVNGHHTVQDIYRYCDAIEEAICAAMGKGEQE